MALKKDIEFKGISVVGAYLRAVSPTIRRGNDHLEFILEYAADENSQYFKVRAFECPYDLDGANPIEQAYEYLKTLEEFSDVSDC